MFGFYRHNLHTLSFPPTHTHTQIGNHDNQWAVPVIIISPS